MPATTEPAHFDREDGNLGEAVFLRSVQITARELDDCITVLLGNAALARSAVDAGVDPIAFLDEIQRVAEVAASACARLRGTVTPTVAHRKPRCGRVLIAEDEPLVAELARRILANAGFQVEVVPHGLAAIERLRREGGAFDALLSDVAMPYVDGLELARLVGVELPGLPVVLMSGYCEDERRHASEAIRRLPFLAKPFRSADLVAALECAIRDRVALS